MPYQGLIRRVHAWASRLPMNCALCDQWSQQMVCEYCAADLPAIAPVSLRPQVKALTERPEALRSVLAALWYTPPIPRFIAEYKFREAMHYHEFLSARLAAHVLRYYQANQLLLPEVLVPVPMLYSKEIKRGYNQAKVLCEGLSSILGIPCENWVQRVAQRHESHQSPYAMREHGAQDFRFFEYFLESRARRIAIVDDVVTTGSTLLAVRRAIPKQAIVVDGWAAAFTPPPSFRK